MVHRAIDGAARMEFAAAVCDEYPKVGQNRVWRVIRENGMKDNADYSAYNFRNKRQEDDYKESGAVPAATPSIYNNNAVEFITNVLRTEDSED